jgi:arylsulfatase A-like enzyme
MDASQPNILLLIADDHAPAAFSVYGSRLNQTPHLDRIAREGLRLDRCFCTNALCTPARATILTGKYSHTTGVKVLNDAIDQTQHATVAMLLHDAGYQTAFFGKWHLGHGGVSDPAGFDDWSVLPAQGKYLDPEFLERDGRRTIPGYVTDVLTDLSLNWLQHRAPDRPFFLVCAHKAPHDPFTPHPRHLSLYADETIPEPPTFDDDYQGRADAARMSTAQVARMHQKDHLPEPWPSGLSPAEQKAWNYQSFLKNYLRCVAAIDENVGRLLAYLDESHLAENTIVLYTADHGFFLGEHGWYDKRFMYEQSIRIPFLMRYPRAIAPGATSDRLILNVDFAPTLLDYAGLSTPADMQGRSFRPIAEGHPPADWRTSMYYRYWMHLAHFDIPAHYGVRTEHLKLIYYAGQPLGLRGAVDRPTPPEWELFDLDADPDELQNVYDDPAYASVRATLHGELDRLRQELQDAE